MLAFFLIITSLSHFPPLSTPSLHFNHPPRSTSLSCFSTAIPVCLPFLSPPGFFSTTPPPSLRLSPLQELASIRRREQLVREAIVGKSPGVYSQLFKRFIICTTHSTALQCLISSGHSQLGQISLIGALVLTAF